MPTPLFLRFLVLQAGVTLEPPSITPAAVPLPCALQEYISALRRVLLLQSDHSVARGAAIPIAACAVNVALLADAVIQFVLLQRNRSLVTCNPLPEWQMTGVRSCNVHPHALCCNKSISSAICQTPLPEAAHYRPEG